LENAGFESFPAYETIPSPQKDQFRLVVGRNALHTHVSTQNNPYLNELCSENVIWINKEKAEALGIADGDTVEVASKVGKGKINAFVTDLIHPEAVFMLHGFGHESEKATRSYQKGVNDALLQENISDMIGGSPAFHDTFVTIKPV
jgi:thiosulfate reductase/polysulfide reductase chain A